MKRVDIQIRTRRGIETAFLDCERREKRLTFSMKNGTTKTYSANDFFICFGLLRADFPEIDFLCKGSKLTVFPSGMTAQMANGLVAYELQLGKSSEDEDIVRIFDFEDKNLTNNIEDQKKFYSLWLTSLGA